jgi:S-adenosylmethionine decarboxylase
MVNLDIPKSFATTPTSYGTPHLTINREATVDLDSTSAFEGMWLSAGIPKAARLIRLRKGPEKLLEVWFSPSADALPSSCIKNGLKGVTPETWKSMLDLVHCKVLSIVESEHVDAYLLSESSLFVFPHKIILKTCGTTTLLYGLPRLLEIAALSAGFPHVEADLPRSVAAAAAPYRVFYSRKNFLFPNRQQGPHRSWLDEVQFLDRLFVGGSAYMIGKMNGEHWYLYITEPHTELTPPVSPVDESSLPKTETKFLKIPGNFSSQAGMIEEEDETLEVLMTDLDEKKARQFYLEDASAIASGQYLKQAQEARKEALQSLGTLQSTRQMNLVVSDDATFDVFGQTSDHSDISASSDDEMTLPEDLSTEGHTLGTVVSDICGLSDVYPSAKYPDARIDAYLFTPCGFSANGVVPATQGSSTGGSCKSTHYFTVHVTPEPQCSYASFETNVPAAQTGRQTADIVEQVVKIFRPGRFSVTMFETKKQVSEEGSGIVMARKTRSMETIEGYKRVERIVHDLDGYELVFRYYERLDWKGGKPVLGEF